MKGVCRWEIKQYISVKQSCITFPWHKWPLLILTQLFRPWDGLFKNRKKAFGVSFCWQSFVPWKNNATKSSVVSLLWWIKKEWVSGTPMLNNCNKKNSIKTVQGFPSPLFSNTHPKIQKPNPVTLTVSICNFCGKMLGFGLTISRSNVGVGPSWTEMDSGNTLKFKSSKLACCAITWLFP